MNLLWQSFWFFMVVLVLIIFFYHIWFLRNPKVKPTKKGYVISPASGKIIHIIKYNQNTAKIKKGRFGKIMTLTKDVSKKGYLICIAMNIFNVHFQRSPIPGNVKKVNYFKGKLRNIFLNPDGLRFIDNERNEILIGARSENKNFNVKIIQIAGMAARRIHCYVKNNQKLKTTDLLGVIKFGSMVVLVIPDHINLMVKENEKVHVGKTKIGELS